MPFIPVEFGHSGIETGMFRGIHRNGMQWNPVVCLFVCFTPATKQTTNQTPCDVVSFCHPPPPPPPLPPHQRHPQRRPMTALPPRRCQRTTITDDRSQPPRNDDKPPKMNTNDGQHKNGRHPQKTNHGPQPPPTTAHKRQPAPTNGHR